MTKSEGEGCAHPSPSVLVSPAVSVLAYLTTRRFFATFDWVLPAMSVAYTKNLYVPLGSLQTKRTR